MSRLTPVAGKKRRLEEAARGKATKPRKRIRKQQDYHSSEDDDEDRVAFTPVNLGDSDDATGGNAEELGVRGAVKEKKSKTKEWKDNKDKKEDVLDAGRSNDERSRKVKNGGPKEAPAKPVPIEEDGMNNRSSGKKQRKADHEEQAHAESASEDEDEDSDDDSQVSADSDSDTRSRTKPSKKKFKRNDPTAFSTSMSKILSTKLPTSAHTDPVLSRSSAASTLHTTKATAALDAKARTRLRAEKIAAQQKGRTKDVLGIERGIAGEVAEKEKGLRKIATRGVVQLFNAFRAAHERAETVRREERGKGEGRTVGMGERERKVNEVSKEGFLELIGGKKRVEEAM